MSKADKRIIALERELEDTRRAAVTIALGMVDILAKTQETRDGMAQAFDVFADQADHVTARVARRVAAAIRSGGWEK